MIIPPAIGRRYAKRQLALTMNARPAIFLACQCWAISWRRDFRCSDIPVRNSKLSGSDGPTQFCYRQERKVLEKVERLIERFTNAFFLRKSEMAMRTRTRSSNRNRQTKKPIAANGATASIRKPSKPPLTEPFYVAVDRQLKSGHQTYAAAEKAALAIKKQHPQLRVTVYDTKEERHKIIEQPTPACTSNKNRLSA